jgi:hypothetical protein
MVEQSRCNTRHDHTSIEIISRHYIFVKGFVGIVFQSNPPKREYKGACLFDGRDKGGHYKRKDS